MKKKESQFVILLQVYIFIFLKKFWFIISSRTSKYQEQGYTQIVKWIKSVTDHKKKKKLL